MVPADPPTGCQVPVLALEPPDSGFQATISGDGLTIETPSFAHDVGAKATASRDHGKWYWEVTAMAAQFETGAGFSFGEVSSSYPDGCALDLFSGNSPCLPFGYLQLEGGDTIGIAADLDTGHIYFRGADGWLAGADPAVSSKGGQLSSGPGIDYYPFVSMGSESKLKANFGQSPYIYGPPAGFSGDWSTGCGKLPALPPPTGAVCKEGQKARNHTYFEASGLDVIALSASASSSGETKPIPVTVTRNSRPVTLVLTSNTPTDWRVTVEPGASLQAIHLFGDLLSPSTFQAPPDVPAYLHLRFLDGTISRAPSQVPSPTADLFRQVVREETGLEISAIMSCDAESFTVGDGKVGPFCTGQSPPAPAPCKAPSMGGIGQSELVSDISEDTLTISAKQQSLFRASEGRDHGKWYWEVTFEESVGDLEVASLESMVFPLSPSGLKDRCYVGGKDSVVSCGDGQNKLPKITSGTTLGLAVDLDQGRFHVRDGAGWPEGLDPAMEKTGLSFPVHPGLLFFPSLQLPQGSKARINFGQQPFAYEPPAGFSGDWTQGCGLSLSLPLFPGTGVCQYGHPATEFRYSEGVDQEVHHLSNNELTYSSDEVIKVLVKPTAKPVTLIITDATTLNKWDISAEPGAQIKAIYLYTGSKVTTPEGVTVEQRSKNGPKISVYPGWDGLEFAAQVKKDLGLEINSARGCVLARSFVVGGP